MCIVPLWQSGYEPAGRTRAELLRQIRLRIDATKALEDGLYLPWSGTATLAGGVYLTCRRAFFRSRLDPLALGHAERMGLATALAGTAAAFERAGTVPGPLRPENIVFDAGGPRLLDPVIANLLAPYNPGWNVYDRLNFLSPEDAMAGGFTICGARFSLGVVLYWLFTGEPPFDDRDASYILERARRQKPMDPRYLLPILPEPAAAAVLSLLSIAAEDRPAPAGLVRVFQDSRSPPSEQRNWCRARCNLRRPSRPRPTGRPVYMAAGAAAVALLAVIIGLGLRSGTPPAPPGLRDAEALVTRVYNDWNEGDFPSAAACFADPSLLPEPPKSNAAIWTRLSRVEVVPGADPCTARAVAYVEETSLIDGVIGRWTGREILRLEVIDGRWFIRAIDREQ